MGNTLKSLLVENKSDLEKLAKNNGIKYMGLFGSYARGEETDKSDIDLLVKFDYSEKNIGLFELYRIQKKLENLLDHEVDVITNPNKFVKPFIEKDLLTIYER